MSTFFALLLAFKLAFHIIISENMLCLFEMKNLTLSLTKQCLNTPLKTHKTDIFVGVEVLYVNTFQEKKRSHTYIDQITYLNQVFNSTTTGNCNPLSNTNSNNNNDRSCQMSIVWYVMIKKVLHCLASFMVKVTNQRFLY